MKTKIPKPYCKPQDLPQYYFDLVEEKGGVELVARRYGSLQTSGIKILRINPDGTLTRLPMSFTSADALGLSVAAGGAYTRIDLVDVDPLDEYRAEKPDASDK